LKRFNVITFKCSEFNKEAIKNVMSKFRSAAPKITMDMNLVCAYVASRHVDNLKESIDSQKYPSSYVGYSEPYFNYKRDRAPQYLDKFWLFTTSLYRNIQVTNASEYGTSFYFAGIEGYERSSDNESKSIVEYAIEMENGGSGAPPRPLFGPTFDDHRAEYMMFLIDGFREVFPTAFQGSV